MLHQCKLMQKASFKLPLVNSYPNGLPIYFLTGKNYLYQTLFCIQSLVKVAPEKFRFILVDDGSFNNILIKSIEDHLPGATIIKKEIIASYLENLLPESSYPILRHKRKVYPHIKKLTDIHCLPGNDWKLVLDSDMLFWNRPSEIIDWLRSPAKPLHMIDCDDSYGYSAKLMEELSGSQIKSRINVGAIGLNSAHINWNKIEEWVTVLENREGASYYLEQALTAMIIDDAETVALSIDEYIVNPSRYSQGKLHHYVDLSKAVYFNEMWQKVI